MFRRAAKEDLKVPDANTGLEMAKSKGKAEIRRKILGNREILVHSAKLPVEETHEFFSSRKKEKSTQGWSGTKKRPVKFQTDSSLHLKCQESQLLKILTRQRRSSTFSEARLK